MRSLAREVVFKFIFSRLFNPGDEGLFTVLLNDDKLNDDDKVFAKDLLDQINNNLNEYSTKLSELASAFSWNRIFNADKCALLIGVAELDRFPNTPIPVVIDESVKLAVKFSTEKSANFVNGILAEIVKNK